MFGDGDMMHSRMGMGRAGIKFLLASAVVAISNFFKVLLYLIRTACNLAEVFPE